MRTMNAYHSIAARESDSDGGQTPEKLSEPKVTSDPKLILPTARSANRIVSFLKQIQTLARHGFSKIWLAMLVVSWIAVLAAVCLLVFLWIQSHRNIAGQPVSKLWEALRSPDRLLTTLTVLPMVIRFAITAQTGILTAVLASLVLRRYLCPLDELPHMLMMRASRAFDPSEITYNLWNSRRRFWASFEFLVSVVWR